MSDITSPVAGFSVPFSALPSGSKTHPLPENTVNMNKSRKQLKQVLPYFIAKQSNKKLTL